jgi:ethanolamine utilization protein EutN
MLRGKVTGRLWSTRRIEQLPQGALLIVEMENGSRMIAFDPLGCGEGEEVIVTTGSVAAGYFEKVKAPVDALIIGSIDQVPGGDGRARRKG